ADIARWRPVAAARQWTDEAWELDFHAANLRAMRGDLAAQHDELVRLWLARPASGRPTGRAITGEVVDDRGRPVAGATVACALVLFADSIGIGLPSSDDSLKLTTTDAHGQFAFQGAAIGGTAVAQRGDQRSEPVAVADHLRLVVAPTRTVSGKVDLAGIDPVRVRVVTLPLDAALPSITVAPVTADGAF